MTDLQKIRSIFCEALEKETQEEREAYLTQICRDDSRLRAEVDSLLRTQAEADKFFKGPLISMEIPQGRLSEAPGTVINRYKLLEKIGEGGMAVVYMAEQEEPIRRKVALKIIKLGMDTKSVIARFEAERQALAMMDHPNIAKVLDAGATETGRPYFVMELVKGACITDYCDANSLSTKERLELFIQVCNAVQHAHQKGIIHRDIKPTNVMVTLHDGKPVPKVIDFGIAKAINQKLTEKTLFTRYAHIIGTPAYMSPEQAELSDLDIDTRTDIYSLGVLLYELLTGTPPFGEEELRKAGYIEMQRIIREQEPPRPSTKLSTLGKTLTEVAKHRSATPDLLRKAVRGDLDWIVMKSLEKDRARRYEAANMLALDIRRHLEHEPVVARGPNTTYRVGKFLRRHRSQTIAVLALAIIAGAMATVLSMWNKDRLQLAEAEGFRHRGILSQAREQYAKADRDAALETVKPILDSRRVGPEAQLLYAGILVDNRRSDEAVTLLGNLLNDRPEIAGAAHSLLARILWEGKSPDATVGATLCGCPIHRVATSGRPYDAIEDHRRQAEALLPETAEAYFLRAMFAITVKEQLASLDISLKLASLDTDLHEPVNYESRRLRAFTYYASRKYEKMKDDALVLTVLRPRDALGYSLRAIAWRELGRYQEAIADYDNAIALTPRDNPQYVDLCAQRNEVFLWMGDYERVIADAQECLKLSPDRPVFQYYIFSALTALGDYDKADGVFGEIVRRTPTARNELREWCAKYVFDTLEAGRAWHLSGPAPSGAPFLPMVEAEETYRSLSAKARRILVGGFGAQWSPDGKKLAFSLGVQGYSGVALYDPATKETELLIVPGKNPRWSPDGRYIAFIRDCQALRLEELTATEREDPQRWLTNEEVWVMKSDGTEPRRLARGGWPSWSRDSAQVYYHSRQEKTLCSISITRSNVEPKRIMACSSAFPSVSPDEQQVAYLENKSLKVKNLASQGVVAKWPVSFDPWGGPAWSPTGKEVCLGAGSSVGDRTGLWIYQFDSNQPVKVLDSQIMGASWAPDGTKLVFGLRPPYFELWSTTLDPAISTVEALGPGQTLDEHWAQMLRLYTRRMQADPQDASAYADRARYYDYLHEQEKVKADMRRWSSIMSGKSPSDFQAATPPRRFASPNEAAGVRRVIDMPFNCQVVFSAERPVNVNEIPLLNVALGQKGRCSMKSFQMPILSTRGVAMSLLGLCLLSGLDTPPVYADFTFGTPANVHLSGYAEGYIVCGPCISADGLELYFQREEPISDIYVARRPTPDSEWGTPVNLGPTINSPGSYEGGASISVDGLSLYFGSSIGGLFVTRRATVNDNWGTPVNLGPEVNSGFAFGASVSADELDLYFYSDRPGSFGDLDIWVTTRASVNDAWGTPVNLGPTVNSAYREHFPCISSDGLALFFDSTRPGGEGGFDLYMSRRATKEDAWGMPVNLGPVISAGTAITPHISRDGSMLYFSRYGLGLGIWQAPIVPTVDFNGDGKVDIADVFIMLEHWHTDYSLCDIGPMPWGDGIVDAQDLIVLAEHMANNPGDVNDVNGL